MVLRDAISMRTRVDQLLHLKPKKEHQFAPQAALPLSDISALTIGPHASRAISHALSRTGLLMVVDSELHNTSVPSNLTSIETVQRKVESREIKITAEGPLGQSVHLSKTASSDSEVNRAVVSLGRCIQLVDQSLPNEVAMQLAQASLTRVVAVIAAAANVFQVAATVALFKHEERPEGTRIVLDVQQRRTQDVVVRLAPGTGANKSAVGATVTVRGCVRLLLRDPGSVGTPLSVGSEPLEEVGVFLCTGTSSWPVVDSRCHLGFVDPTTSSKPSRALPTTDEPKLNSVALAWETAKKVSLNDEEDGSAGTHDDVGVGWEDALDNSSEHDHGVEGVEHSPEARKSWKETSWQGILSATMEHFCWGDNEHGELSEHSGGSGATHKHHSVLPVPGRLSWSALAPWEQVRMVATSARHTVVCTTVGSVYSCGDGSDGALGHGDAEGSRFLRLVLWFTQGHNVGDGNDDDDTAASGGRRSDRAVDREFPEVVAVSAGGDLFGSHSAALDAQGRVFTWGIGSACGRGNRKPAPEPGRVMFEDEKENGDNNVGGGGINDNQEVNEMGRKIASIACGGGYCAAITNAGALWCWGNWVGGRLGLGPVPSKVESSYMHGNSRKRLLPLLLRPRRVTKGLEGVLLTQVACGDAHTCARTTSGRVFVWGQNESGQLGLGPSLRSGQLETALRPVPHPTFPGKLQPGSAEALQRCAVFVACGASHTLVIDGAGDTWSWGACGGACLGHPVDNPANTATPPGGGDGGGGAKATTMTGKEPHSSGTMLHGTGRARHTFRPTSELQAARAVRLRAAEVTAEAPSWSLPRRVQALRGAHAFTASAGERHSAVLLRSGRAGLCGDGMALVHQLSHAPKTNEATTFVQGRSEAETMKGALAALEGAEPVVTPRIPCAAWFPVLEGKHLTAVACGGQHTVVTSKGERLGLTLGAAMLNALKRVKTTAAVSEDNGSDDGDDEGVGLRGVDDEGFETATADYDCVLLTAGSALPAHRFVLARRSRVLRELIAEEERPNAQSTVLELLLPELKHDTALALREYLYTDTLSALTLKGPGSSLPYDLHAAAVRYDLPRLAAMCANSLPASALGARGEAAEDGEGAGGGLSAESALPPSTLVSDLGSSLGDSTWADVRFVAQGKPIFAHKAVLSAASEYFRVMLKHSSRGSMQEKEGEDEKGGDSDGESEGGRRELIEIVVPDSHVGMLRLLIFIYTGHLGAVRADEGTSVLLDDLISADRFQLLDMKRTCESLIEVDASNCVAVLEVAHVVNAPRLVSEALRVTCLCLAEPLVEAAAASLGERHRELGELLLQRLFEINAERTRDKHHVATGKHHDVAQRIEEEAMVQQHGVFPLFPLFAMLFFAFLYAYSSRFIVLGPAVPILNTIGVVCLVAWGAYSSSKKGTREEKPSS